ncbi:MAG: hypothetical protein ACREQ5_35630 [Candidatus Dormibacteria bacterium]
MAKAAAAQQLTGRYDHHLRRAAIYDELADRYRSAHAVDSKEDS